MPMLKQKLATLVVVLPILCWTSRCVSAEAVAAFDRQLALFTVHAMEGEVASAEALLRDPAFSRSVDRQGHNVLFAASVAGNLEILDLVLALSPNLDLCDIRGASALFYSAAGSTLVVRRLIERGAEVNLADLRGRSPLIVAVMMKHIETAGVLLAAGADVNHKDHRGATALFYAADAGFLDLVELLVVRGANPNLADDSGSTPLQVARSKEHSKVVHFLSSLE
jgi:ankyrin repeat protein